jgi:hypothetical protein
MELFHKNNYNISKAGEIHLGKAIKSVLPQLIFKPDYISNDDQDLAWQFFYQDLIKDDLKLILEAMAKYAKLWSFS